jgi:hypothetical protein
MELGEGCDCEPPVMEAVRWEEAASAAADGSRLELSVKVRPSYTVGDGFLG